MDAPEEAKVEEEEEDAEATPRAPQPKLRLHHFEHHTFGAAGEPIRLALSIGGLEFEDHRVERTGDEWPDVKNSGLCPFKQMPVLETDDETICQSNSILRYVGLLTGLYPADDIMRASKVDEVLGAIQDIKIRIVPSLMEKRPSQKMHMRQALVLEKLPWWLTRLEASIRSNDALFSAERGFCVGDTLTIADLALVCFLGWFEAGVFMGIQDSILEEYPRLLRVLEVVDSVPKVFRWRKAHPTKYLEESKWIPAVQGLQRVTSSA